MLVTMLSCLTVAEDVSHDGHYVEMISDSADGDHVMVRNKRSPDAVCKYKKGDWSQCDTLVMVCILSPRVDTT